MPTFNPSIDLSFELPPDPVQVGEEFDIGIKATNISSSAVSAAGHLGFLALDASKLELVDVFGAGIAKLMKPLSTYPIPSAWWLYSYNYRASDPVAMWDLAPGESLTIGIIRAKALQVGEIPLTWQRAVIDGPGGPSGTIHLINQTHDSSIQALGSHPFDLDHDGVITIDDVITYLFEHAPLDVDEVTTVMLMLRNVGKTVDQVEM